MKKFKIVSTIVLMLILILGVSKVNAYSGVVDVDDDITLPSKLTNGAGTITLSRNIQNADVSFQFVEMDSNTYKKIIKLKEELLVAQYFNIYEADQTEENYDVYVSAYKYYQEKYNETVDNYTTEHIDEVESIIIGLLPDYTSQWQNSTNNQIKIDLSTFSGTKYFTAWTKVVSNGNTIYEAEVYELTGTKQEDNKSDDDNKKDDNKDDNNNDNNDNNNNDNNNGKDDSNKDNNNSNNNGNDDSNKDNNNSNNNGKDDGKKDDTTIKDTTTSNTKIPQTGESNFIILIALSIAVVMAVISYRKMKK